MIKMVVLKISGASQPGSGPSEYLFTRSRTFPLFLIGRDNTNDVVIAYPTVSRSHLLLKVEADGTLLARDSGSKNGTWINSSRLSTREWTVVPDGCEMRMGGVLVLLINGGVEDMMDGARLYDPERERRNQVLAGGAYASDLRSRPQTARFADIEASIQTHERFSRAQTMLLRDQEDTPGSRHNASSTADDGAEAYESSRQAR